MTTIQASASWPQGGDAVPLPGEGDAGVELRRDLLADGTATQARSEKTRKDMYAIVKTAASSTASSGPAAARRRLAPSGLERHAPADLYRSDEAVFDKAARVGAGHGEGRRARPREKLRVFKFKPSAATSGARPSQDLTQIEVTDIAHGKAKAKPAKPIAARDATSRRRRRRRRKPATNRQRNESESGGSETASGKGSAETVAIETVLGESVVGEGPAVKPAKAKAKAQSAKPKEEPPMAHKKGLGSSRNGRDSKRSGSASRHSPDRS